MHEIKIVVGTRQLVFACSDEEAVEAEAAARLLNEEIEKWIEREGGTSVSDTLALAGLSLASESPRAQVGQTVQPGTLPNIDPDQVAMALNNLAEGMEAIASDLETLERADNPDENDS